jgi:hypothetical protein
VADSGEHAEIVAGPYVVMVTPGEPETGLWCDRCNLPSLVRFPLYLTSEEGSSPCGVGWTCPGCDDGEVTFGERR